MSYLAGAADQSGEDAGIHSNGSAEDRCSRHYTLLQRCPLLCGLPDLLWHVATHTPERQLRDKDILFLRYDPEDFVGPVFGGHLCAASYGLDGREPIVNDIHPGEVIGKIVLIQLNRRETSAYAPDAVSALIPHRRRFVPLIIDTEFLNRALALLCSCLREASGFVERVCPHCLGSRLMRHLLASLTSERPEGVCATLPINQSILVVVPNASRPKFNAQPQTWKRGGLINCHSGRVLTNDLGRLRRKAELPAAPLPPR